MCGMAYAVIVKEGKTAIWNCQHSPLASLLNHRRALKVGDHTGGDLVDLSCCKNLDIKSLLFDALSSFTASNILTHAALLDSGLDTSYWKQNDGRMFTKCWFLFSSGLTFSRCFKITHVTYSAQRGQPFCSVVWNHSGYIECTHSIP